MGLNWRREQISSHEIGKTTYYNNKDELFMGCHEGIVSKFHIGLLHSLSREELVSAEIRPELDLAYRHLEEGRAFLYPVFQGKDSQLVLR